MSVESWVHQDGFQWHHVHLDDAGRSWLEGQQLDPLVLAALTELDTRPGVQPFETGAVVVLRGVNLNAGAEADDMISSRIWCDDRQAISVWLRPLRAMTTLRQRADAGKGPSHAGELASRLALGLSETATPVVAKLGDKVDEMEDRLIDPGTEFAQDQLSETRRALIVMRRYFAPQRDALAELAQVEAHWLLRRDAQRLDVALGRSLRITEELDALGQRCQVMQDHLTARRADHMNRQMFVLSIVAALFLPLGFLTGLLGVNVGGIPGTDSPVAFWIVCCAMLMLGIGQWLLFRAMGIVGRS